MEDEWVSCSELRKRLDGPAYSPDVLNRRLQELAGLGQLRVRLRAALVNGKIREGSSLEVDAKFLIREPNRRHELRIDISRNSLWSEASGGMSMIKLEGAGIMFHKDDLEEWFADDFELSAARKARTQSLVAVRLKVAELPANWRGGPQAADKPYLDEMARMIRDKEAKTTHGAATKLVELKGAEIKKGNSDNAKVNRLSALFKVIYDREGFAV